MNKASPNYVQPQLHKSARKRDRYDEWGKLEHITQLKMMQISLSFTVRVGLTPHVGILRNQCSALLAFLTGVIYTAWTVSWVHFKERERNFSIYVSLSDSAEAVSHGGSLGCRRFYDSCILKDLTTVWFHVLLVWASGIRNTRGVVPFIVNRFTVRFPSWPTKPSICPFLSNPFAFEAVRSDKK